LASQVNRTLLARFMVTLYCDALHEVFSDFFGASFSEDENFALELFSGSLVDSHIRCFGFDPAHIKSVPGLAEAILERSKEGDCHVALLHTRWAVNQRFYRNSEIGRDPVFDARVVGTLCSALVHTAVTVMTPRSPRSGTGEEGLALAVTTFHDHL